MTRRQRVARLASHRARELDAAALALAAAMNAVARGREAVASIDAAIAEARAVMRQPLTAGDWQDADAHVRSLLARRRRLEHDLQLLRREERARRAKLASARVELRKLEVIGDNLAREDAADEERALQRATDDRAGSASASRSS